MKRAIKIMMVLGLSLGLLKAVEAAQSDNIVITITPNAAYDVTINTDTVGMDLGTVDLEASTQTVTPATVTINSTYAQTDLKLQGSIVGGWSFDTSSATLANDQIAAWATFTATTLSTAPAADTEHFNGATPGDGSDLIDGTSQDVGTAGGNNDVFEATTGDHQQDMDALATSEAAHMWLYFRLPDSSTDNSAKNINITLTAGAVVP